MGWLDTTPSGQIRGAGCALTVAAVLEVGGDYFIRKGLPKDWVRMLLGVALLVLYGFAVNLWWRGDFSKLLGLYVVMFFVVSQVGV